MPISSGSVSFTIPVGGYMGSATYQANGTVLGVSSLSGSPSGITFRASYSGSTITISGSRDTSGTAVSCTAGFNYSYSSPTPSVTKTSTLSISQTSTEASWGGNPFTISPEDYFDDAVYSKYDDGVFVNASNVSCGSITWSPETITITGAGTYTFTGSYSSGGYPTATDTMSITVRGGAVVKSSELEITQRRTTATWAGAPLTLQPSEFFDEAVYIKYENGVFVSGYSITDVSAITWNPDPIVITGTGTYTCTGTYGPSGGYPAASADMTITVNEPSPGIVIHDPPIRTSTYNDYLNLQRTHDGSRGFINQRKNGVDTLWANYNPNHYTDVILKKNNSPVYGYLTQNGEYTLELIDTNGQYESLESEPFYILLKPLVTVEASYDLNVNDTTTDLVETISEAHTIYPYGKVYTITSLKINGVEQTIPYTFTTLDSGKTVNVVISYTEGNYTLSSEEKTFIVNVDYLPDGEYISVDMTEYVKEKGVYDTMPVGRGTYYANDTSANYAKNCAYYVRNNDTIEALGKETQTGWLGFQTSVIEQWEKEINKRLHYGDGTTAELEDRKKWRFEIEYTSIGSQTYRASRGTNYNKIRNNMVRIDNQSNSMVDVDKFIALNQQKLKRLSNKTILIQQSHLTTWSELADLFQVYENNKYVIFSKNLVINKRNINAEYYASENYVLTNYFTNMNSAKRNFERIDSSKSVDRNEFKKIYYELSFTQPTLQTAYRTITTSNSSLSGLINGADNEKNINIYALSPFIDNQEYCGVLNDDSRTIRFATANSVSGQSGLKYLELVSVVGNLQAVNNIVSYTFQLEDSAFAGFKAIWETQQAAQTEEGRPITGYYNYGVNYNKDSNNDTFNYLGVVFGGHKYLDEVISKGKFTNNIAQTLSQQLPLANDTGTPQSQNGMAQAFALPMYKDNAEKLGLTMNFEWVSDNDNIEILQPAEHSLYKLNRGINSYQLHKPSHLEWWKYNGSKTVYTDSDFNAYIEFGSDTVKQIIFFKYNNAYYADYSHTKELQCYTPIAESELQWFVVYDQNTSKLYLKQLTINAHGGLESGYTLDEVQSIELTSKMYLYLYVDDDELKQVKRLSWSTISWKLGVEAVTLPNATQQPIINCNNGTGVVDFTAGTITLTPANATQPITINDSIRIKNYTTSGGNVVIYLKIKDYFV